jgi:hypothetical protein
MPCHLLQKSCNNHLSVAAWISLSVCLIIHLSASQSVYLTISGSVSRGKSCLACHPRISICLSVKLSVCLLLYLPAYLSVCLSIYLWHSPALSPTPEIMVNHLSAVTSISICLSVKLSVCLLLYLSAYLPLYLSISGTVLPCHPLQKSLIITSQLLLAALSVC